MNLKLKAIAAVAVLGVAAGASHAAIVGPNPGPGDLLFNIWDADNTNNGYTLDLGINANALSSSFSVTLSGNALAAFNGNSIGTLWDIVGGTGNGVTGTNYFYTTVTSTANAGDSAGSALGAVNNLSVWDSAIGPVAGSVSGGASTGGSLTLQTTFWAATMSQGGGSGVNDSTDTVADQTGTDTSSSAFFKRISATGTVETVISGLWTLTFNSAGGNATSATLTWTPTAVPLPAAAWLLGSGLLGLAGIGRRRLAVSTAVAA